MLVVFQLFRISFISVVISLDPDFSSIPGLASSMNLLDEPFCPNLNH